MYFSIGIKDGINNFICSFFMPLFFFVSGFFAFKSMDLWDKDKVKVIVTRKFKVQIVGALFFLVIYSIFMLHDIPDLDNFFNPEPNRYWFTFALFKIFITYLAFVLIAKWVSNRDRVFWILQLSFAIACMCFHFLYNDIISLCSSYFYVGIAYIITPLFFYFMPYFTFGLVARANIYKFEKIISHDTIKMVVLTLIIAIWSLISLNHTYIPFEIEHGATRLAYPLGILTLILLIQFFYNIRGAFDRNTIFFKVIRLIGRRTLDIYFIHYFFIPDLHFLNPYLTTDNPIMLQLTIGLSVTLIIVGLSLLVGQVIRMSPTLAEWLLGVKKKEVVAPL